MNFTVSDEDTKKVIGNFLDMGHSENIIAMVKADHSIYAWFGELLVDERFNVRLGLAIVLESLKETEPEAILLATPSLLECLQNPEPLYRGEAISLLGIIDDKTTLPHIKKCLADPSPQVIEMAEIIIEEMQ
ncbi:MAG: adaptin domain-containing protein [Desulfotalea sp.]